MKLKLIINQSIAKPHFFFFDKLFLLWTAFLFVSILSFTSRGLSIFVLMGVLFLLNCDNRFLTLVADWILSALKFWFAAVVVILHYLILAFREYVHDLLNHLISEFNFMLHFACFLLVLPFFLHLHVLNFLFFEAWWNWWSQFFDW